MKKSTSKNRAVVYPKVDLHLADWKAADAPIKGFRELRVYETAFERAMEIFGLSKAWPAEEKYSLTDQIRRSSRSVCANIAEAWRKRRYPASFVSKLSDSDAEAAETLVWLQFAERCGYISTEASTRLSEVYDHICAQLTIMMQRSDQWRLT